MPFQIRTLLPKVSEFCAKAKKKPLDEFKIYELTQTEIQEKPQHMFRYDTANKCFSYLSRGKAAMGASLTIDQAKEMADSIQRSSYYGSYRDVTNDDDWKKLYDHSLRSMAAKFGNMWSVLPLDVIPCYYCGLALPINLIEVDHWFEKARRDSGAIQAILKVFRASGLTMSGSTGAKGTQFQTILSGTVATIATRGTYTGTTWNYQLNRVRENITDPKRQLTINGEIMLSILYHATDTIGSDEAFEKMFVNHFINLVPCCPNCNKLKNTRI